MEDSPSPPPPPPPTKPCSMPLSRERKCTAKMSRNTPVYYKRLFMFEKRRDYKENPMESLVRRRSSTTVEK